MSVKTRPQPGERVKVWIGAITGSPGIPPANAETRTAILQEWDRLDRAYIVLETGVNPSGNCGQWVAAPAINPQ